MQTTRKRRKSSESHQKYNIVVRGKITTADREAEKYLERNSNTIEKTMEASEKKEDQRRKKICSVTNTMEKLQLEALVSYESSMKSLEVKHEAELQKK